MDEEALSAGSSAWRCWVVDDGDQLLGHVCVQLFEKMPNPVNEPEVHAYLTNFYVVPELRSRGLGRKTVEQSAIVVPHSRRRCSYSVGDSWEQIALSPVRLGGAC